MLRDRDTSGSGFDERLFYLQNRHHDVVCLIRDDDSDEQVEMVRYSAYGVPFGLPAGDVDSDGDCDGASEIQGLGAYDVRGDLDLDGDNDSADETLARVATLGRWAIGGSVRGFEGNGLSNSSWEARHRQLVPGLGVWVRRDPVGYGAGANLYSVNDLNPITNVDPLGLTSCPTNGGDNSQWQECCEACWWDVLFDAGPNYPPKARVCCCDGTQVACLFLDAPSQIGSPTNPEATGILEECLHEHECKHIKKGDGVCIGDGPTVWARGVTGETAEPPFIEGEIECIATLVAEGACDGENEEETQECYDQTNDWITDLNNALREYE